MQQMRHPCGWWRFTSYWTCQICPCPPCLCHDIFPFWVSLCCSSCPGWTPCLPFCGTLPCWICWTLWQSLPSWELRQTSSSGDVDSSVDLPWSFPGNSGEEVAESGQGSLDICSFSGESGVQSSASLGRPMQTFRCAFSCCPVVNTLFRHCPHP